ncbi:hypothetical protein, conserved [Plasmodium gonderi]|uniref:SAM dependent methyltransferase n=1 Tax=Plasmodium gonderi TaxID=77519 RepID=A0A1Y1JLF4_PLAGO|nr:hypothetical protein, conserved [Plasmodium gonderi]GAW83271.1 hypothetical protein, conserved [Plasmodium gonderi]
MHYLNCFRFPICQNFKTVIINNHVFKRKISDICESKIIALNKSKEYDSLKIYKGNIYNNLYENQILQGVKVHKVDAEGYGEIALYSARQNLLFFLKFYLLIPDEQVNIKVLDINKKKKKTTFQLLCKTKKSKYEIVPECEYFSKCGGCIFQHINYNFERQLKKNLLISLCEKYNIRVLTSGKDYLQNVHDLSKTIEPPEEDLLEIAQVKREYMYNDVEDVEGKEHLDRKEDFKKMNISRSSCTNFDCTPIQSNRTNPEKPIEYEENGNVNDMGFARLYDFLFSKDYHYRNKSSINFSVTDNLFIGYYKKHSYEICDIKKCYIHDEHIQNVFTEIKKEIIDNFKKNNIYIFNKINNNGYLKSVDIKMSKNNSEEQILVNFIGFSLNDKAKKHLKKIATNLSLKDKSIKGILYNVETNKLKQMKNETILYGQNCIYHTYNGYTYKIGANTFFQPNQYLNECIIQIIFKLIEDYKINAKNSYLYDLFCGIGFYSLPLAELFKQVICVDYSIDNIKNLEENIKINKIKNIKCFNLNLFNLNNLKQINIHIRRYIVNSIKSNNYSVYPLLKEKINSSYILSDSEAGVIENLQVHSPYMSLPNFIYECLNDWNCKGTDNSACNIVMENDHADFDNNISQNIPDGNLWTVDTNSMDRISKILGEFVIPIPDLIIINPPRKGCEKIFRRWLRGICCRFIIYISCNVHSQFRDMSHLINLGYMVKEIIPLDTFPRTQHFESVVLLEFDFNRKVDLEKRQIMEYELNEMKTNKKKRNKKV